MEFVDTHGKDIAAGLACNFTGREVCVFSGNCGDDPQDIQKPINVENIKVNLHKLQQTIGTNPGNMQFDPTECQLCQFVVNNIKTQLPNAKGVKQPDQIRAALSSICNFLKKPESQKVCLSYVQNTGDDIIDVLSATDPSQLCIQFFACPAPSTTAASQILMSAENYMSAVDHNSPLKVDWKELPQKLSQKSIFDEETEPQEKSTVPLPVLGTDDCTICTEMSMIVYQMVNYEIPIELDQALQRACSVINPLYYGRCLELMDKYREQLRIRVMMFPRLGVTEYCKEFNPPVCSPYEVMSSMDAAPVKSKLSPNSHQLALKELKNLDRKDLCQMCQNIMSHVGPLIKYPGIQSKINSKLQSSCQSVPSYLSKQCKNMLEVYGPYMEAKILETPKIPYYQVCYEMENAVCSTKFISEGLRNKLMEVFLSRFPKGLIGNEQCFQFANELSDFVSTVAFFANADSLSSLSNDSKNYFDVNKNDITKGKNKDSSNRLNDRRVVIPSSNHLDDRKVVIPSSNRLDDRKVVIPSSNRLDDRNVVIPSSNRLDDRKVVNPSSNRLDDRKVVIPSSNRLDDRKVVIPSSNRLDDRNYDIPSSQTEGSENEVTTLSTPEDEEEGIECELCKEIIKQVEPYIQYPILQKFLQEEVDQSCLHIDLSQYPQCLSFVKNYSSVLVKTALYEISRRTKDICTLTDPQFCPVEPEEPLNPVIYSKRWHSMDDLRDIDKIDEPEDYEVSDKKHKIPALPNLQNSQIIPDFSLVPDTGSSKVPDCVICNEIVETIHPSIHGSKNMDEIKDLIMRACFSINRDHFSQCLDFLPKYGPKLRESIIADSTISSMEICKHTKTLDCEPSAPAEPSSDAESSIDSAMVHPAHSADSAHAQPADLAHAHPAHSANPAPMHSANSGPSADSAPMAHSANAASPAHKVSLLVDVPVEKKLNPLGSGSLTRDILLKVCEKIIEKLVSGLEEICMTFINKHFPEEEMVAGSLNMLTGVHDCDVCQEMMTVVSMEKNYETGREYDPHSTLYESCTYLPVMHRAMCKSILRRYGDVMEPYIISSPQDAIGACDNVHPAPCYQYSSQDDDNGVSAENSVKRRFINEVLTQRHLQTLTDIPETHDDDSSDCLLCKDMVKEIRRRLMMDHNKSLKDTTEEICQYLPEESRHNCSEVVLSSGSKIENGISWFVYDDANYVCEQAELCDPFKFDTKSKDPCLAGPDFWCMNFQNAEQCDQIEYCQRKFRKE